MQATQAYDRASELFKRTLISQQALDDAKAALQSKRAIYNSAIQNAKNLRASIQASEATMKLAARQLRDTEIRAPFDGFVQKRLVNMGELVKTQMPVMAIVRLDPLKVTAEIPEKMAPWINPGQTVDLKVDAYQDRTFTGKVSRISPGRQHRDARLPLRGARAKPRGGAQAGHVRARPHRERKSRFDSDRALMRRFSIGTASIVYSSSTATSSCIRELSVGERVGDRIEVMSGVKAGERVAISDVDSLDRRRGGHASASSRTIASMSLSNDPVDAAREFLSLGGIALCVPDDRSTSSTRPVSRRPRCDGR